MAKGSNNIRGRSSDASKPYDVSNSFVKRVASRVTELLPQPSSWLSRWMTPSEVPNASDYVGHSLSSTITSRPPATTRAELNLVENIDHHAPAAKKPRTGRYNSPVNQKFLRSDGYSAEDISPIAVRGVEPIAGPSSLDTRPELVASTPAVPSQQMTSKVNGDDCSETSESTSGCSSLVPQAQSSSRSLGGSRYARSVPGGVSLDELDRRRPSFCTTTFNAPLRASMRARLGSSPFYSGRTMYGGSSQAYDYAHLVETSQYRQASNVRRVGPTVRPPPSQQSSLPLSSTAKRILDALEQFSTPMIDAKKMPVVGTKRKLDSGAQHRYVELNIPSTSDLLRVKRRERLQQSTLEARQTVAQSTPIPPVTFPTPSSASTSVAAEYTIRKEETDRKKHTGKVKTKEKLEDDEIPVEVKLPTAVLMVENLPKIDIAIPPPPPALSVTRQPKTSMTPSSSKFVFSQPTIITSVVTPVSVPTSMFKFSEPLGATISSTSVSVPESNKQIVSSASLLTRTSTDEVSGSFIRQKNDDKKKNDLIISHTVSVSLPSAEGSAEKSKNSSPECEYHKGSVSVDDKTVSTSQKWECFKCRNNNSSSLDVCISCQANKNSKSLDASKNNIKTSVSSGFGNLYKKPVGTWECSTCLIQNKGEATKCVACDSSKPVVKEKTVMKDVVSIEKPVTTVQASSEINKSGNDFGNKFKKPSDSWTCDVCMINNNVDKVKCAACEAPKPGMSLTESSKPSSDIIQSGSGFGNLFKKASGSWTCEVCMINNDADKVKCAACETLKPGTTVAKTAESSGPKFSFGIPSISTSSPGIGASFSFGIPKGGDGAISTSNTLSVPKLTSSSDSAQTPTPTFSFGIPKPATTENNRSNAVTSSTNSKSTFQFGSGSVQAGTQETNVVFGGTPTASNVFSNLVKKSTSETTKPAELDTPTFSVAPSSTASNKPETPVVGVNSQKSSTTSETTSNTSTPFAFGSNNVTQNDSKKSNEVSMTPKPQSTFMFGAKQEGFGSGLPSSTTNTLSSSSPSNVLKFGDTKTVSSGSGAASISSVSTQASIMTPKPNNIFNFGSSTEKKTIPFGPTPGKETTSGAVGTTSTENKPTFGSFGGATSTLSAFGSTNTFGSHTFGSKEHQPSPFVPQTTTSVFGQTTASTSTSTFSTFGQTNAFQPPQQENKSSSVFTFTPQKETATPAGFVFNPVVKNESYPSALDLFAVNDTSTTAPAPSTTFSFDPKFPTGFNASASAPTPVFGAPTPQQASTFGEQTTSAPVFNFGTQSAQQPQNPANPVFEFGSNQQQSVAAAPAPSSAPTFMFGSAPAFDPNIKPTFNFTQGAATPVFSAVPTGNSASPAQPQNRRIRKAVRRTNISSVRN